MRNYFKWNKNKENVTSVAGLTAITLIIEIADNVYLELKQRPPSHLRLHLGRHGRQLSQLQ